MPLLGGAAATWPVVARAAGGKATDHWIFGRGCFGLQSMDGCFRRTPTRTGWIENCNVAIEYRWSEGRTERYREITAEFVRMKVDVIVTVGSAVPTVRQATSVIPIVFAVAIDPVGSGLC
jgi:ABC transporter substrate binding protein